MQIVTRRPSPPAPLDETNVGHQMLQKLGWKGDKETQDDNRRTSSNSRLRKDWDRIEAIAGNPTQQRPNNSS
jgi:hypothetical protein